MTKARIVIAETIAETGLDRLRAAGFDVDIQVDKTPEQLHAILPGASALIVRSATMVDAQMLKAGSLPKSSLRRGSIGFAQQVLMLIFKWTKPHSNCTRSCRVQAL